MLTRVRCASQDVCSSGSSDSTRSAAVGREPAARERRRRTGACELAAGWMEEAGLEVERDPAGNLVGRFGLAAELRRSGPARTSTPSRRAASTTARSASSRGSRRSSARAARGRSASSPSATRSAAASAAVRVARRALPERFVELHIEQGPRLEAAGAPLGVVTGIVGYDAPRGRLRRAPAGHAGTTPMDARDDALVAGGRVRPARARAARAIDGAVATVGRLEVEPGAVNVIPGRVRLTVDARAPDDERLDALLDAIGLEPASTSRPSRGARAEVERRSSCERRRERLPPLVELPSAPATTRASSPRRASRPGCSSSAASTAASATRPTSCRATRTSRSPSTCSPRPFARLALALRRTRIGCAPSQRVRRPSSRRFSVPSTTVAKWLPASGPPCSRSAVAVREEQLGLADAAGVEQQLARRRVAGRVLGPDPELELAQGDPVRLAAPAAVDDLGLERQQPPERRDGRRRGLVLLERATKRKSRPRSRASAYDPWRPAAIQRAEQLALRVGHPGHVAERHRVRAHRLLVDRVGRAADLLGVSSTTPAAARNGRSSGSRSGRSRSALDDRGDLRANSTVAVAPGAGPSSSGRIASAIATSAAAAVGRDRPGRSAPWRRLKKCRTQAPIEHQRDEDEPARTRRRSRNGKWFAIIASTTGSVR